MNGVGKKRGKTRQSILANCEAGNVRQDAVQPHAVVCSCSADKDVGLHMDIENTTE